MVVVVVVVVVVVDVDDVLDSVGIIGSSVIGLAASAFWSSIGISGCDAD